MLRLRTKLVMATVVCLGGIVSAGWADTLDDGLPCGSNTFVRSIVLAQTFRPIASGTVTEIIHGLDTRGGMTSFNLYITNATMDGPPPTDYSTNFLFRVLGSTDFSSGSQCVNGSVLTGGGAFDIVEGQQYALILEAGRGGGSMAWRGNSGAGSYPRGAGWELSGGTWRLSGQDAGPKDHTFTIFGDIVFDCPAGERPVVRIDSPNPIACVCDTIDIIGEISDADGNYQGDWLEYKASGDTDWIRVASASTPRTGVLYTWDATSLPEGNYFLRVTAEDECLMSSSDVTYVRHNLSPPNIDVRVPPDGGVVGGNVCVKGFIRSPGNANCGIATTYEYRLIDDAFTTFSGGAAWPATLVTWRTLDLGLIDGLYELRITSTDRCGFSSVDTRTVTLDNTPPVSEITYPEMCEFVDGIVEIRGTASDANINGWVVQFLGGDFRSWQTIASGSTSVVDDVLAEWDVTNLRPCAYTIRLVTTDQAVVNCFNPHRTYDRVTINVGSRFDVDADRDVDLFDYTFFLLDFTGPQ